MDKMKALFIPVILILIIALSSCRVKQDDVDFYQKNVSSLKNDDIEWTRGHLHFAQASIDGNNAKYILKSNDKKYFKYLFNALKNDNQYIVCHVLLTMLSHDKFKITSNSWNGLEFISIKDKKVLCAPGSQEKIIEMWEKKLKND